MANDTPDWTGTVTISGVPAVTISGTVTATITGPVTVTGSVTVSGTVNIGTISGSVAISGPVSVQNVTSGTIIVGNTVRQATTFTVAAGVSSTHNLTLAAYERTLIIMADNPNIPTTGCVVQVQDHATGWSYGFNLPLDFVQPLVVQRSQMREVRSVVHDAVETL